MPLTSTAVILGQSTTNLFAMSLRESRGNQSRRYGTDQFVSDLRHSPHGQHFSGQPVEIHLCAMKTWTVIPPVQLSVSWISSISICHPIARSMPVTCAWLTNSMPNGSINTVWQHLRAECVPITFNARRLICGYWKYLGMSPAIHDS